MTHLTGCPRFHLAILLLLVLPAPSRAQAPAQDVFDALNAATVPIQNAAKEAYWQNADPAVIAGMGAVIIRHKGEARHVGQIPVAYHLMKSVGHGPRAIWSAVRPAIDGLDPAATWRAKLASLRVPIEAVRAALPGSGLSAEAVKRDTAIASACLGLIDRYQHEGLPQMADLQAAMRALTPLLLADVAEAARLQVDSIDRDVRPWWNSLSDAERARTIVVVRGSHPARVDNVVYSYFVNLLGFGEAGRRVIHAEGIFDDERARGVLSAVLTDRLLALDVFDDPMRMDRDLMGDGARARLLELFGRLGRP